MRKPEINFSGKRFGKLRSRVCVYAWRRGKDLLYVGLTTNVLSRIAAHNVIGKAEPMLAIDSIQIWPCRDYAAGERLERLLQTRYRPKYSIPLAFAKRTKEARRCIGCDEEFLPKRWWQRYCSDRCRNNSSKIKFA